MQVSCDGMSESKSTNISLDVYSSRLKQCQVVFPHRLVRPLRKNHVNNKEQFTLFLNDIVASSGEIVEYIADNLKRATGKDCKCHSAAFPCEYCFSCGVRYTQDSSAQTKKHFEEIRKKIENDPNGNYDDIKLELAKAEKQIGKKKSSHIVWPATTQNGEPRTVQKILAIIEKIEEQGLTNLSPTETKGVVGRSPLLSIPNFDMVRDVPAEYLHSVCLGVGKRMIVCTFAVGEVRIRTTKRKLSDPAKFNEEMLKVKVVRECSRRNRELDFSVMKGQEFQNIILFFTPIVLTCIEPPAPERKLWILFMYMIRACILPIAEFKTIDLEEFEKICSQFYNLYDRIFGMNNCSYNTHVVGSHLLEMRYSGPLTETSAFNFESFYGEIRNSFVPGTKSTLKQILSNILIKRSLSYHCCENSIYFSEKVTLTEDNSLIYLYENREHHIYKILAVKEETVICKKVGRYDFNFPEMPKLNMSHIGVYKRGPMLNDEVELEKKKICGKVFSVLDFYITCPNNVLREK